MVVNEIKLLSTNMSDLTLSKDNSERRGNTASDRTKIRDRL